MSITKKISLTVLCPFCLLWNADYAPGHMFIIFQSSYYKRAHRYISTQRPVLYQYMSSLKRLLILTATFIIQFSIRCFAITSSVKWKKYTVMMDYTVNSVDTKICLSVAILLINCVCLNRFEKPSQSCTSKRRME